MPRLRRGQPIRPRTSGPASPSPPQSITRFQDPPTGRQNGVNVRFMVGCAEPMTLERSGCGYGFDRGTRRQAGGRLGQDPGGEAGHSVVGRGPGSAWRAPSGCRIGVLQCRHREHRRPRPDVQAARLLHRQSRAHGLPRTPRPGPVRRHRGRRGRLQVRHRHRLKRGGMHWSADGANAIIALRCAIKSNRFDRYRQRQAANP